MSIFKWFKEQLPKFRETVAEQLEFEVSDDLDYDDQEVEDTRQSLKDIDMALSLSDKDLINQIIRHQSPVIEIFDTVITMNLIDEEV
jgi:hypothetical protein